jgi:type II secretory pathway pseudopilin PulG
MVVVSIIGILLAIGIPKYNSMMVKAGEGSTKGNLATLRSTLSIYFGDNGSDTYPSDDLSSLVQNMKYLPAIPPIKTPPFHANAFGTVAEAAPTDTGLWSYDNVDTSSTWGRVVVGCTHQNTAGLIWTSY